MAGLDIDSLFTNIPLENKTLKLVHNNLFKNNDIVHGLKKVNLKNLSLATKESFFIGNNIVYKQIDGVGMGSPLGSSLAHAFLAHHEKNWLDSCLLEYIIEGMLMIPFANWVNL